MTNTPLNILVVGAGMYVCGSGPDSFGTILPFLIQEQHQGRVGEIHIAGTRPQSAVQVQEKLKALNSLMGTNGQVVTYPKDGNVDTQAYRKAIDALPKPSAAIVSVPDHLHADITKDLIAAGIHPMVVKPLTPTVEEAKELIKLADRHNVYGAVEFHKRFDEANRILRQKIRENRLGDICYAVVQFSQRRQIRNIFGSWVDQTNIFQYLGVHYADMVYYLTGAIPVRVMATGQAHTFPPQYDAIQATIQWQKGLKTFVSTILTNWIDPDKTSAMSEQKITVVGTEGRCRSDQKDRGLQLVTQTHGVEDINPYFTQLYGGIGQDDPVQVHGYGPASLRCFLQDVEALNKGSVTLEELNRNRPSFRDALVSTAVLEAVNKSLQQDSQWIAIQPQDCLEE